MEAAFRLARVVAEAAEYERRSAMHSTVDGDDDLLDTSPSLWRNSLVKAEQYLYRFAYEPAARPERPLGLQLQLRVVLAGDASSASSSSWKLALLTRNSRV